MVSYGNRQVAVYLMKISIIALVLLDAIVLPGRYTDMRNKHTIN